MPRTKHPRELAYGRGRQMIERMSDKKTVPGYAGTLDMQDPESIRRYVADVIAMTVEPSIAALKRLEMLLEMADALPQVDAGKPRGELRLIDAAKAAELLQKRLEQK
jgi:hypothetical protein